jgi:3-oxoacyl-[acyl-carrier protein] reductase
MTVDLGLRDVRVLVTAASQGIGRACAAAFVAEEAQVFLSSSDESRAAAAAAQVGAAGSAACDIRRAGDIDELIDQAVNALGGLDVLVINSGPPPGGTFAESRDVVWSETHDLVLMSAVRLVRTALPHLVTSGRGRVIGITGYGLREPKGDLVASEANRAAVAVALKSLAREVGHRGVTVNNIAPGPIETDRLIELQAAAATRAGIDASEQRRRQVESIPVRRIGSAAEVGALCAFLASDLAGFITGQTIVMDGGINHGV